MSKIATLAGLGLAFLIILLNMVDWNQGRFITAFFNLQGLAVVVGGTLAAVLINYPLSRFSCIFSSIYMMFTRENPSVDTLVEELVALSHLQHTKGVLALEKVLDQIEHDFLRFSLGELLLNQPTEQLKRTLENEVIQTRLRHIACQEVFENMASYAPAFGMMGTVMGLIIMMTNQGNPDAVPMYGSQESQDMMASLLTGMGLALVTTFYGVLLANIFFMPTAGKLKDLSEHEYLMNQLVVESVLFMKANQPPLVLRDHLLSFVNKTAKLQLMDKTESHLRR